ncbi:hypothetical protein BDV32DRAFT_136909 [Aspergillus pseudonomiae]|uniref:Uncharacterized protein n=1 Tax=Aspergillus pseudonomiae TaxID=1506151 RepID=A0A5N6I875_9EURO|nr:uncharacterized protein BDV37DRAFT_296152 [Aspergillus pseudonomiae]KAB8262227.1 hypothetical protein BDV32DRAFT_136909 [Aspergillus pseudonomiae]KAE8401661.1 hypothetical protein BDV37DRAFT_296152 [Aspergillus pseudonomiae]
MTKTEETPLHFFDIFSTLPGTSKSWSSNVLKIRMVLNYKGIPYTQSFHSYPDIAPLLQSLSVPPHKQGRFKYTLPAICHPSSVTSSPSGAMMDSLPIACHLDEIYPDPPLFPSGEASYTLALAIGKLMVPAALKTCDLLLPKAEKVLDDRGKEYFVRTRTEIFGKPLSELRPTTEEGVRQLVDGMKTDMEVFIQMLRGRGEGKKSGPFLEGEKAGYADFILVTFLSWSHRFDLELWREIMDMGNGEFRALWDASVQWLEGQGEEKEWVVPQEIPVN